MTGSALARALAKDFFLAFFALAAAAALVWRIRMKFDSLMLPGFFMPGALAGLRHIHRGGADPDNRALFGAALRLGLGGTLFVVAAGLGALFVMKGPPAWPLDWGLGLIVIVGFAIVSILATAWGLSLGLWLGKQFGPRA